MQGTLTRLGVLGMTAMLVAAACTGPAATTAPTGAPATGAPATAAPMTDAPATDGPATDGPATDAPDLTGSIFVSGSSTVEPISLANAEKFSAMHPEVQISVEGPGTSDGFAIFCDGGSDVSDASRAIKQEEADTCATNGVDFIEMEVAIDGLSVITSVENPVTCLSFLDIYALLGPESTNFDSWSDANELAGQLATELGDEYGASNAPYPDAPLEVTAPGEESGTFDSFVELVIGPIAEAREQDETTRPDYQSSPDDNVIIEGISGSASSLGWVGYAFAVNNADSVRAIPIDGGDGCVEPTETTISDGSYPIARSLYIYPSVPALDENPALAAFLDFYMSDDGFASVSEVGYVSLPEDRIAATRQAWEERRTGKFTD